MTGSSQALCHVHDGGFCGRVIVTQINQRSTQVTELTLIHVGDVGKLGKGGCGLGSHNICTVAQVNHGTGKFGQVFRRDAQLTRHSHDLCNLVRRGCNLGGHLLNLSGKAIEFSFGSIYRLSNRGKGRLKAYGCLDGYCAKGSNRCSYGSSERAPDLGQHLPRLFQAFAGLFQVFTKLRPGRTGRPECGIGALDLGPGLFNGSLGVIQRSFCIDDGIGGLLDLVRIIGLLCCDQLLPGSFQRFFVLFDLLFLKFHLAAQHGQLSGECRDTLFDFLDSGSSQLKLALSKTDLLAESRDRSGAVLNSIAGSIPVGLSKGQRLIATVDLCLRNLNASPGVVQVRVCLTDGIGSVLCSLLKCCILSRQLFDLSRG